MEKFATHRLSADAQAALHKSIKTRSTALQKDIHRAAVAVMLDALPETLGGHLNADRALGMVQALSAGMPRNKLVNWFTLFTNIRITVSNGGKSWSMTLLKPGMDGHREFTEGDVTLAIDTPYWVAEPEKDIAPLDVDAAIAALFKKVTTAVRDGKVKDPAKAKVQLAALAKLAPAKA